MTAPPAARHFGETAMEARGQQIVPRRRTVVRLWLPLTPLFLLLAPLALLLSLFLYPFGWRFGVNPPAAAVALGRVLLCLGGVVVDVDTPAAVVRLKIL